MSTAKIVTIRGEDGSSIDYPEVDGILMPPIFIKNGPETRMAKIRNYQSEPGDLLICSFPKSGTHWTCNLLHVMRYKGPVDEAPSCNIPLIDVFLQQPSTPEWRLIHSHMRFKYLPKQHLQQRGKIVLVVRNPKDVVVSYFHHLRKDRMLNFKQSWDDFVQHFLCGKVLYGSYFDYLLSWQKAIEEQRDLNLHLVYYEDLHEDGLQELKRLQRFLGYELSEERLRQVLSRCNISRLRDDVDQGRLRTYMIDKDKKGFLYRKGEIGDWQNHLTVAQNLAFDKVIADKLAGSMFTFKYLPTTKHKL